MPGVRGALGALVLTCLCATPARAENSVTVEPAPEATEAPAKRIHTVATGDSLWTIARKYDCMPEDLKRENELASNLIMPGKQLAIPVCSGDKPRARVTKTSADGGLFHEVQSGDTLFQIAKKYETTVEDIKVRNGIDSNTIMPGQQLDIVPGAGKSGRAIKGQSVGKTHRGRLVGATQLGKGAGYFIRRPERAFGANHAVFGVKRAIGIVRRRHPKVHTLAIGDLSAKKGGKITQHKSHQSGRDVDVGLYFKKKPKSYPKEFVNATKSNLDRAATWTLLTGFTNTADADNGVEVVFLDYGVQRLLYDWAKDNGVSKKTLNKVFQYPNGRGSSHGLVRHEPGHADHLHVRFKCPKGDNKCL